jgi:hypothetical protein
MKRTNLMELRDEVTRGTIATDAPPANVVPFKTAPRANGITLAQWRMTGIGMLRIIFGLVWGIDAWFKWQPDFINNFANYLSGSLDGQPAWVQAWINFWINIVQVDPHVFAHAVAIGETAIAPRRTGACGHSNTG